MHQGLTDKEVGVLKQAGFSEAIIGQVDAYTARVVWPKVRRFFARKTWSGPVTMFAIIIPMLAGLYIQDIDTIVTALIVLLLILYGLWKLIFIIFGRRNAWRRALLGRAISVSFSDKKEQHADFRSLQALARLSSANSTLTDEILAIDDELQKRMRRSLILSAMFAGMVLPVVFFVVIAVAQHA